MVLARKRRRCTSERVATSVPATSIVPVSGVKIPALLSREEEEQFYERMFLLEELEQIVATLYQEFLTIRLDVPTWNEVMLPALKDWVQRDEVCTTEHYPSQVLKDRLGIVTHPRLVASA